MIDATAISLAVLYLIPLTMGAMQIHRLIHSRNNKLSIRSWILFLLTGSCVLRTIFWAKVRCFICNFVLLIRSILGCSTNNLAKSTDDAAICNTCLDAIFRVLYCTVLYVFLFLKFFPLVGFRYSVYFMPQLYSKFALVFR
jgi:hypothetical protein